MELHLKPVLRHIELPSHQYNISVEPISYSSGTIVTGKIIIQIEILKCFVAIKTSLTAMYLCARVTILPLSKILQLDFEFIPLV